MGMDFDPNKNATNIAKHGVPMSEGDGVLDDPLACTVEDESAEGEQRWLTVGTNVFEALYVVCWTQRKSGERAISVHKPEPKERKDYEKKR
jgi:uncharacterized DUF497 family protein